MKLPMFGCTTLDELRKKLTKEDVEGLGEYNAA